jgi:hypothetical protein
MTKYMRGKENIEEVGKNDLFNPWISDLKKGTGTLLYNGAWNLFDQILVSQNMLDQTKKRDYSSLRYFKHQIFRRDYLFQTEGKYKGNPKRTHAGGQWLNGYADHLPVIMYMLKEVTE